VLDAVLSGEQPKIVYLERRDRVAHAVSYARATLTGVWRKEQEGAEAPTADYSQAALDRAMAWIETQRGAWEDMFRDLRIEPLRLWYEDAVARPAEAAGKVAAYLGVAIDPSAAVKVPAVEKQSQAEARTWVAKYVATTQDAA
jgi:LPS sulfotransferase NodH